MKVVSELINYFRHDLTVQDLRYLKEQGFYSGEVYEDYYYDEYWEEEKYYEGTDAEVKMEEITAKALDEAEKRSRKGKGGRRRKKKARVSLADFNQHLLDNYISKWEELVAPLYPLCTKVKGREKVRKALFQPYKWEESKSFQKLFSLLKYSGNWIDFEDSLMKMEVIVKYFFREAGMLGSRDQQKVRHWVMGEKKMSEDLGLEAIWWVRQVRQLQVYALRGLGKYVQQECVKGKKATLAFEQFLTSQSELFILLLLRDFSRKRSVYKGSPDALAVHFLGPEGSIEQALDAFFVCAPRDFVLTMQSLDRLPEPKGADSCETEIDRRFSKLPLPDWALKLRTLEGYTWHVRGTLLRSKKMDLDLAPKITLSWDVRDSFPKYGCIAYHLTGRPLTDPVDGLLPCSDGIFDLEKMELRAGSFVAISSFSEGLAPCKRANNSNWEFIDEWGQTQIPGLYQNAYPFSQGLAAVKKDGKWGFINTAGEEVIPFMYGVANSFSEGLAAVWYEHWWGFRNLDGDLVFSLSHPIAMVESFSEGLAAVSNGYIWGFIDSKGDLAVPLMYREVKPFSEGLAAVLEGDLWGFIDKKGAIVIPCQYSKVQPFTEGRAVVRKKGHRGDIHIDKKGEVIGRFPNGNFDPYQKNAWEVRKEYFPGKTRERQNLYTASGELIYKGLPGHKVVYIHEKILVGELDSGTDWYLIVPLSKIIEMSSESPFAPCYRSGWATLQEEYYTKIETGMWLQSQFQEIIVGGKKIIGLKGRQGFFIDWEKIKAEYE